MRLTGVEDKVMRALAAAAIDPGELLSEEVVGRVDAKPMWVARAILSLREKGLVHDDGEWPMKGRPVVWTEAGRQLAIERRYPCSPRT